MDPKVQLKIQLAEKKAECLRAEELTQNALAAAHAANAAAISHEEDVIRLKLEQLENADNGADDQTIVCPSIPAPNMSKSNSIRAKNTGIGATNLWTGTHTRFPKDDIRHFKAMVWGWKIDRKTTMDRFHDIGFHYVDLNGGDPSNIHAISSRRRPHIEKVRVGDRIHTYSGTVGTGVHYRGTVLSVYTPVTQQNLDDHLPPRYERHSDPGYYGSPMSVWRRCQVQWDLDTDLTAEWRAILTQPGCGTVIPLKIPSH